MVIGSHKQLYIIILKICEKWWIKYTELFAMMTMQKWELKFLKFTFWFIYFTIALSNIWIPLVLAEVINIKLNIIDVLFDWK